VLPARAAKPRDKAKVEVGVQSVERWIVARLRHPRFFSLPELNAAIRVLLDDLNRRPFKKLRGSRLRPLPPEPYGFAEGKKARVHIDYPVPVHGHSYSVPYQLVKQPLEVRLSANTVELFHQGHRVARHPRSPQKGRHTTPAEPMPQAPQA
jgi:transposase